MIEPAIVVNAPFAKGGKLPRGRRFPVMPQLTAAWNAWELSRGFPVESNGDAATQ
jgi:hypothetical protein